VKGDVYDGILAEGIKNVRFLDWYPNFKHYFENFTPNETSYFFYHMDVNNTSSYSELFSILRANVVSIADVTFDNYYKRSRDRSIKNKPASVGKHQNFVIQRLN
jgi:hypothetical protein